MKKIEVASADIYYKDTKGKTYHLIEEKQIFKDGTEKIRKDRLKQSISEKINDDESPTEGIIRGIKEELGISKNIKPIKIWEEEVIDKGAIYKLHRFICFLNKKQFKKDGYVEKQKEKTSYFKWIEK